MKPRPPAKRGSFKVALLSVAVSMWLRPRGNNSPPLQKMRQPLQFPLPPNKRERRHSPFGGADRVRHFSGGASTRVRHFFVGAGKAPIAILSC